MLITLGYGLNLDCYVHREAFLHPSI